MRQPVDSGRRSGFVYVVLLYFELCECYFYPKLSFQTDTTANSEAMPTSEHCDLFPDSPDSSSSLNVDRQETKTEIRGLHLFPSA